MKFGEALTVDEACSGNNVEKLAPVTMSKMLAPVTMSKMLEFVGEALGVGEDHNQDQALPRDLRQVPWMPWGLCQGGRGIGEFV